MTRWIGRWIMAVGIIHIAVGFVVFGEPLRAIVRDGVWNAVDGHAGRPLAFWFVFLGLFTIVYGSLVDWMEGRGNQLPRHSGWGFLVLVTLGVVMMPASGGWLLLPPAIGALVRSRRLTGGESAA